MHVMQRSAFRKWLSTKNRSPQRSTPRHPIAMASTAKPPDPMPCELAAVLLPESRAHGFHMQKTLFPGPVPHVRGGIRARPVPACRVRSCDVGLRWESERHPGCRETVPGTAGWRRPLVPCCSLRRAWGGGASAWASGGPGGSVSYHFAESVIRRHLGWCGVLWLFQGCCSGDRLGPWADATRKRS